MTQGWGFSDIWNSALSERDDRPLVKRDHLWASELWKSPIDVWHKMRATPITNPPNDRSKRKFEAGNVFEWICGLILKRCGILKDSQTRCEHKYDGLLKVTGKIDFMAGGKPDYEKWEYDAKREAIPEVFYRAGEKVIRYIQENFPEGIEEQPLEIKSVSSFMFEALEARNTCISGHRLQLFHYLKSLGKPHGIIVYICRDDLRLKEFVIQNNEENESEYKGIIEAFTKNHHSEAEPEKERMVKFDKDIGKFSRNQNVGYSSYLTKLYGFKTQKEFEDIYMKQASKWNRVMKRIKNGDKMTPKNLEVLKEIKEEGFDVSMVKSQLSDIIDEGEE